MNLQRKLTLVVATGAVAFGAGHFVQKQAGDRMAADLPPVVVSSVTPVAAGPSDIVEKATNIQPPVLPGEAAPIMATPQPVPQAAPAPVETAKPVLAAVEPAANPVASLPAPAAAPDCAVQLDLIAQPGAMIGLTMLAPCHPDQRVVLRHAGLAVTGRTSASGALFASLPALTDMAEVKVGFASGDAASASLVVPDFQSVQRFAVQWHDADAFQLHAFENGAGYDQPGHISASYTGKQGETGTLILLGDASTDLPLLAEVYTFGPDKSAEVVLEAAVTETTCGREILGETILAKDGLVEITDLTLAMPGCDAVGDFLVLKNLAEDMTLAAAN